MNTDRTGIFHKGVLCLALLLAAGVIWFGTSPVQAAETGRWGEDTLRLDIISARITKADDTDDSYDIAEILETQEESEEEAEEAEEAEDITEEVQAEETVTEITGELMTPEEYEALDWSVLATADVDEYLNVRGEASSDGDIVGRIYAGAVVAVEETAEEWTLIRSGDVEGYAATEYLIFGEDAKTYCEEEIEYVAVVTADSVRIRAAQSTDSSVIVAVSEGKELTWDTEAETEDGWVAVTYSSKTCYISADYVETGVSVPAAMTNEEAEEYESSNYSTSDLTLLAALIQCEAGGEIYAGKLAVGAVVMNRVKSSSYPNTISGVIYQSGQFSPASSGKLASVLSSGNISSSCYAAAKEALSGVSNVGSCLHFHAGSGSGTQIGNQVFY